MNSSVIKKSINHFLILFFLTSSLVFTQTQSIKLPLEWKFKIGDNAEWANPTFNDSTWGVKNVGTSWAATGLKENVFAWYRTKIIIPSSMKNAIEKGNGIKLNLGKIDDVDFTYFNGKLIGQMGSLPPKFVTKWDVPRVYFIPPQEIQYDKENVIAVRVFSPDIGGVGMYEGPYNFSAVQWSDYVSFALTISETKNNSFTTTIKISNEGNSTYKGSLEYFICDKSNKELHREVKEIQIQPGSGDENEFTFAVYQPNKEKFFKVGYIFTESESKTYFKNERSYLANKQIEIKVAEEPKPIVQNKVPSLYTSISFKDQHLNGYLEKRFMRNLEERLIDVDEDGIMSSYMQRQGNHPWAGEHIGKYLEAASNAWKYTHDARLKKLMDRMMYTLINTQLDDGYLGTYSPDEYWTSWDVWSHKYNLYGLLGYYVATGYKPALETCKRIGDLLCKTFGNKPGQRDIILAGTHVGMAATSVLDPMVELYRYTGDKKYLDFCYYIIDTYEQKNGPKIISSLIENGQVNKVADGKAYELLSNIAGLVNLYRVTGNERFLKPALIAWDDIVTKRLYITGTTSSWEHFQNDDVLPAALNDHVGEGCVTVTWIQLNHDLLDVTGEVRFAEQLEKTIYNHLLAAENPENGCISDYTSLMDKKPFVRNISCCQSSIPRGIAMIPYFTFGNVKDIPTLMMYEPASYKDTILSSDKINVDLSLKVLGNFPKSGKVTLIVKSSQTASFPIALRVPSWCSSFVARVGGKEFRGITSQYLTIDRTWKPREVVRISFNLPVQEISGGKSYPDQIALQRGPQVLAYDQSLNKELFKELEQQRFYAETSKLKYEPKLLPKEWIGKQAYSVQIKDEKKNSSIRKLALVPYADASQTGAAMRVWLPLDVINK